MLSMFDLNFRTEKIVFNLPIISSKDLRDRLCIILGILNELIEVIYNISLMADYKSNVKSLVCLWEGCGASVDIETSLFAFSDHISAHLPDVPVNNIQGEEMYTCCWKECKFTSKKDNETTQHIKCHAYHTRLKAYGQEYSRLKNIPSCSFSSNDMNEMPNQSQQCLWNDCNQQFTCLERFIGHIDHYHAKIIPLNDKNKYPCLWKGCELVVTRRGKMRDHCRVHSGDKALACPRCGQTFNQLSHFSIHCWKQQPVQDDNFQCCHCLSFFPTEKLLRRHIRVHINMYKCIFCELTCRTPAELSKHIRYRHLNIRPFKCTVCPKGMKSSYDLVKHMETHKMEVYVCDEDDCDFVARNEATLMSHTNKVHRGRLPARFACHLCDKEVSTGRILTRHLLSTHNLHKPKGFSRFLYRLESDGKKRLQLTRLESGDIAEDETLNLTSNHKTSSSSWQEDVDNPEEMEISGGEITSRILIEELDNHGNVISSSVTDGKTAPLDAIVIADAT